jgi:hypothetical protein
MKQSLMRFWITIYGTGMNGANLSGSFMEKAGGMPALPDENAA